MKNATAQVSDAIYQLNQGWHERIEYSVKVGDVVEERVKSVRFPSILSQLRIMARMPSSVASNGCNPNKSGSRPPVNMAPLNLIDDIHVQAIAASRMLGNSIHRTHTVEEALGELISACALIESACESDACLMAAVRCAEGWVKRGRLMLGYDIRETILVDAVCGECGGTLVVAVDASSDVRCIGTEDNLSCGTRYPKATWLDLL